jgi:hypothetical protein
MPSPIGHGEAYHDPDADVIEYLVAAWLALAA